MVRKRKRVGLYSIKEPWRTWWFLTKKDMEKWRKERELKPQN